MWSNKEADFFPEINKSFTFPGMGLMVFLFQLIVQNVKNNSKYHFLFQISVLFECLNQNKQNYIFEKKIVYTTQYIQSVAC